MLSKSIRRQLFSRFSDFGGFTDQNLSVDFIREFEGLLAT